MLTNVRCLAVWLGLRLGLRLGFSVRLVSGYAHVFTLLAIVIVPRPVLRRRRARSETES